MALRLEQKQRIVDEVHDVLGQAPAVVLADYRGLTVADMTELRVQARNNGVYLRVVRNTLARRAVQGTDHQCLHDALTGPTLLALSQDAPSAAASLLKDFAKEHEDLRVTALSVGGAMLGAEALDQVAALPTREEALAMLLAVLQAPIGKLARTLNEVPGKLVRTLAAVGDAGGAEQTAESA